MEKLADANSLVREGKMRHDYEELQMVLTALGDKIPGEKSISTNTRGRQVREKTSFYIHNVKKIRLWKPANEEMLVLKCQRNFSCTQKTKADVRRTRIKTKAGNATGSPYRHVGNASRVTCLRKSVSEIRKG